jgi:ribosome-associated heat shock protein Hsp15
LPPDRASNRFAVVLFTSMEVAGTPANTARIDKWLWAVRLFKTRALATDACRVGSVLVAGHAAKPARDVRAGELVEVRQGLITRTLRVVGVPRSRVGPKKVPEFCADLTPQSEFEKAREQRVQQFLAREKGSGRPTKRDRRAIDRLLG